MFLGIDPVTHYVNGGTHLGLEDLRVFLYLPVQDSVQFAPALWELYELGMYYIKYLMYVT